MVPAFFGIEGIKKKLASQDKNIEPVFSYLDELIEKQKTPKTKKQNWDKK